VAIRNLRQEARVAELLERGRRLEADLVFVGDSISLHWEDAGSAVWKRYYGERRAINLGISGEQTGHLLWRIEQGHLDALRPRLVVLLIGTNNIEYAGHGPQEIAEGVRAILQALRARGIDAPILLLGLFPRGRERDDAFRLNSEATNRLLADLADGRTVHFRDIGAVFTQPDGTIDPNLMPDHLHLSAQGYALWAEAIESDVARHLGEEVRASP
jgi:lysophospholipase L1-like esterase